MLVALPAIALLALWLALVSRGCGRRRSLLWAALAGGLFILLVAEGLSLFQALGRGPLAASWGLAAIAAAAAIRPSGLRTAFPQMEWRSPLVWVCSLTCALSLGGAFLSAVLGAPNMVDVQTYHMPCVVYWQVNQSIDFYPASYYQQLSLQPFSEFAMLHLYALAQSDRFVQLAQWMGWLAAIVAASLVAKRLGAGWRGQALAAGICAALPSGAIQASGAKPDVLVASWLLVALYFALGCQDEAFDRREAAGAGLASGLALLSKGTAYVFGAGIAPVVLLGLPAPARNRLLRAAPLILGLALLVNLPHYARNYAYNGHILGDGSAKGLGESRFSNDRIGVGVTVSNILRNLPLQLAFRPSWNQAIYEQVVEIHQSLGLDPDDPASTWNGTSYGPSSVSMHEGEVANVRHMLLLGPALLWLLWRRRRDATAGLLLGCFGGALMFCILLKWQPWHARMHLPLFACAAPALGVFLGSWRPRWLATVFLLWLAWALHPYLLHNSLRPLGGPRPVYASDRFDQLFIDWVQFRSAYRLGADLVARSGCKDVGIDTSLFEFEYPFMARLRERDFSVRFRQEGVENPSARYADRVPFTEPCAVICLRCAVVPAKRQQYARFGPPARFDQLLVFVE